MIKDRGQKDKDGHKTYSLNAYYEPEICDGKTSSKRIKPKRLALVKINRRSLLVDEEMNVIVKSKK